MPIMVNVPGGGLDSAGQGMAAAQGYRANEQKMRLQEQGFKEEIGLAKRKLDIEESDTNFRREQLAQQQAAAGDLLVAQAKAKGPMDPEKERALRLLSPETQERLLYAEAQGERVRAEQATFQKADADLTALEGNDYVGEEAAQIREQAAQGLMTPNQAVTAIRALGKKASNIAHVEQQRMVVTGHMEKWAADPTYDMPDESDDAHDDVIELYEKLNPNAEFDPKANYGKLWDQYKFLTTKGMREASRALLEADLKKKNMVPVDADQLDALMESASKDPEFREKAGVTYGQAEAFVDKVAAPLSRMMGKGGDGAFGGGAGEDARERPTTGGRSLPDGGPGSKLKEPIGGAERKQMYGAPDADLQTDFMQALHDMGFTSIPQPGDPEYGVVRDVMKALKAKRAAQPKKSQSETIEDAANKPTRGTMQ